MARPTPLNIQHRATGAIPTLLVICLAASWPRSGFAKRAEADVILVGSSSVFGPLGVEIERVFEARSLIVRRISHRSTGFARPDFFDWQAEIDRIEGLETARGVVVAIGGNDAMALRLRREESTDRGAVSWVAWNDEARWKDVYRARVIRFLEGLCAAGARKVVLLPPPDGEREGWAERIERVQSTQLEAARESRCSEAIDTRGRAIQRGDTLDGVHLGQRASRDLLARIGDRLLAAFTSL